MGGRARSRPAESRHIQAKKPGDERFLTSDESRCSPVSVRARKIVRTGALPRRNRWQARALVAHLLLGVEWNVSWSSLSRNARIAIVVGLVLLGAVALLIGREGRITSRGAPPEALNTIRANNEEAAATAAARMKQDSQATTRAADARIEAEIGNESAR